MVELLPLLNLPPHWFTGLGLFLWLKRLQCSEGCWKKLLISSPVFPDIAPMYSNLFALWRESDRTWFPPNHVFKASQSASETLQFRLRYICRTFPLFRPHNPFLLKKIQILWSPFLRRYYFPGWHNNGSLLYPHRYGTSKGTETPVMDDSVMAYLFLQVSVCDGPPHRLFPEPHASNPDPNPSPTVAQRLPEWARSGAGQPRGPAGVSGHGGPGRDEAGQRDGPITCRHLQQHQVSW